LKNDFPHAYSFNHRGRGKGTEGAEAFVFLPFQATQNLGGGVLFLIYFETKIVWLLTGNYICMK